MTPLADFTTLPSSTALLSAGSTAVITTAVITIVVIFVALVGVGFAILFRRRGANAGQDRGVAALSKRANILLVRMDDAVKASADEFGFALAQFGEEKTREFQAVLATARTQLTEAFGLKQRLDDAHPDSETQTRDWNARIIHLCESIQESLAAQEKSFASLRALEKNAPENLAAVRAAIAGTSARLPASSATLDRLKKRYAANAVAPVSDSIEQATGQLQAAQAAAEAAQSGLSGEAGTVADSIQSAQQDAARAAQSLDAIDRLASTLAGLTTRLEQLAAEARQDLAEARTVRDAPPDPAIGAAVNAAMGEVDRALAAVGDPSTAADPAAGIQQLENAIGSLDLALGSARNQAERLEHARTALTGALLTARSQISTTADFIDARRGGVGADARTRLAEAQRLLTIAEAEADPVIALDTARRSATFSRDADALARYDLMAR
jgi:DNA repair exonuclease SbcCD ATPase subunit